MKRDTPRQTRTALQIAAHRQGEAVLGVCGAGGEPLCGAWVSVEQESHAFPFTGVLPDLGDFSERERDRLRSRLREVFPAGEPPARSRSADGPEPAVLDVARPVPLGTLRRELDRLAAAVRVVEVRLSGRSAGGATGEDTDHDRCDPLQERGFARRVADLYTLCFSHPAVAGIVWQGFCDGEPRARGGGLVRRDLAPRHAHKLLQKLIHTIWHTRAEGFTDGQGRFRFRGFYGTYRAAVRLGDGPALIRRLTLAPPPG